MEMLISRLPFLHKNIDKTNCLVKNIIQVSQKWRTNYLLPYPGCLNVHEKNMEKILQTKKFVTQSRTGLQIYEGHDDQLNRPGPMA
jgi:hypothetical protein